MNGPQEEKSHSNTHKFREQETTLDGTIHSKTLLDFLLPSSFCPSLQQDSSLKQVGGNITT